jgi:hypothetical protein
VINFNKIWFQINNNNIKNTVFSKESKIIETEDINNINKSNINNKNNTQIDMQTLKRIIANLIKAPIACIKIIKRWGLNFTIFKKTIKVQKHLGDL